MERLSRTTWLSGMVDRSQQRVNNFIHTQTDRSRRPTWSGLKRHHFFRSGVICRLHRLILLYRRDENYYIKTPEVERYGTPPAHRCPRQRQRVTEGTAMAP